MNKKLYIGVAIILAILVVWGLLKANIQSNVVQGKEIIKIGYIAPLSGNVAFLGEGVKNAAELALADLNKKSTRYKYELIFEDDVFTPSKTATAAQKLIAVDKVDVIVTVASAAGGVASPIAEKARVVHFGIASDPVIAKGDFNFINWTPPSEEVKVFINQVQNKKVKRVSVFGQNISGVTAVIDELKSQIKDTEIEVVSEDISNFGDKDFRTSIEKMKKTNPDYILLTMFSPELEIITKQIRDAGIKIPLTAIESFELSDNPALFEGLWYVNAADPTEKFSTNYFAKFGKNPSIATPNSYDIIGLVARAAESFEGKGKPTTTELARALSQIRDYDGALGDNLSIDADGLVLSKAVVREIRNGKPVTIGN